METDTLTSYGEVLDRLDSFHNLERAGFAPGSMAGGSARMAILMKRLGSPHAGIPSVHIAGTKGKGSVSHMTAAALTAAGLRTGLYTSPHVDDVRERIQVRGRPVEKDEFVRAALPVIHEAEKMENGGLPLSWFEVFTAVAFVAFRAARVDAMVLEVGLGGRLDSTNLPDLNVRVCGITPISKDHEAVLGSTLSAIAGEKAGIFREHIPVVTAPQAEDVMNVLSARAKELSAGVLVAGRDIRFSVRQPLQLDKPSLGQRLDFETRRNVYPDIPVLMPGRHQAENAALALGLVDLFLEYMDREPLDALVLKRAWRTLALPARLEVVSDHPWHIVDGAHNPASAWVAAETVDEAFSADNRTLVFGVASDKDYRAMLRILAPLFRRIIVTGFNSSRAVPASDLADFLGREFPKIAVSVAEDVRDALRAAESQTPSDGLILTTGSLWLAGEMRACRRVRQGAFAAM